MAGGVTDPFPLQGLLRSFWSWRADHQGALGVHHARRGDAVRALDCLNKQRSLGARLDDPPRQAAALVELLDVAVAAGKRAEATSYLRDLLALAEAHTVDLEPLCARLDRVLAGCDPAHAGACARRLLRRVGSAPATHALACLGLARHQRGRGTAALAIDLLAAPLAWAVGAGELDAEVALRSELATCLLAEGRIVEAVDAFARNVHRLEAAPASAPGALEQARRNLAAARARI